ncbi:hypothetical protein C8Q79DRAFT_629426 [Trametes meyenii]|nr:hypothetical protein C8Q79DRAFT_629426 [Trametes meyenii]
MHDDRWAFVVRFAVTAELCSLWRLCPTQAPRASRIIMWVRLLTVYIQIPGLSVRTCILWTYSLICLGVEGASIICFGVQVPRAERRMRPTVSSTPSSALAQNPFVPPWAGASRGGAPQGGSMACSVLGTLSVPPFSSLASPGSLGPGVHWQVILEVDCILGGASEPGTDGIHTSGVLTRARGSADPTRVGRVVGCELRAGALGLRDGVAHTVAHLNGACTSPGGCACTVHTAGVSPSGIHTIVPCSHRRRRASYNNIQAYKRMLWL